MISDPFPREHGFYLGSVPLSREQGYYGSNLLEGVSLSAKLLSPVYYGFAVSGDSFPKIGLNTDYGDTSSDLPGFTPPSAVPGRYEKGVRPKVSLLGFGGGNSPPSLSISGSGFEGSWSAGAISGVKVTVSDTTAVDVVPDDVTGCFTAVAVHFIGALDSDLAIPALPYSAIAGSEENVRNNSSCHAQVDEGLKSTPVCGSEHVSGVTTTTESENGIQRQTDSILKFFCGSQILEPVSRFSIMAGADTEDEFFGSVFQFKSSRELLGFHYSIGALAVADDGISGNEINGSDSASASSDLGAYIVPISEVPKSWVTGLVIHSMPTSTPTTESLGQLSKGAESGPHRTAINGFVELDFKPYRASGFAWLNESVYAVLQCPDLASAESGRHVFDVPRCPTCFNNGIQLGLIFKPVRGSEWHPVYGLPRIRECVGDGKFQEDRRSEDADVWDLGDVHWVCPLVPFV